VISLVVQRAVWYTPAARQLLSFDEQLKALAAALGISVYPELKPQGRATLFKLRFR